MIDRMIAEWLSLRDELAAVERAERSDITDHHGRVWIWVGGDLYRHCSLAWPKSAVLDGRHQLPCASVRSNPNYVLCHTCTGEEVP